MGGGHLALGGARLYLAYISPISRRYLAYISLYHGHLALGGARLGAAGDGLDLEHPARDLLRVRAGGWD